MRLSIHSGNMRSFKRCRRYRVFLNGVDVTKICTYADTRKGEVVVFDRVVAGEIAWIRLRGKVRVIRRKKARPAHIRRKVDRHVFEFSGPVDMTLVWHHDPS